MNLKEKLGKITEDFGMRISQPNPKAYTFASRTCPLHEPKLAKEYAFPALTKNKKSSRPAEKKIEINKMKCMSLENEKGQLVTMYKRNAG